MVSIFSLRENCHTMANLFSVVSKAQDYPSLRIVLCIPRSLCISANATWCAVKVKTRIRHAGWRYFYFFDFNWFSSRVSDPQFNTKSVTVPCCKQWFWCSMSFITASKQWIWIVWSSCEECWKKFRAIVVPFLFRYSNSGSNAYFSIALLSARRIHTMFLLCSSVADSMWNCRANIWTTPCVRETSH